MIIILICPEMLEVYSCICENGHFKDKVARMIIQIMTYWSNRNLENFLLYLPKVSKTNVILIPMCLTQETQ